MRTNVVLVEEGVEERREGVGVGPGVRDKPFLQCTHEALGNPVGLGPMARDKHMDEAVLVSEAGKVAGCEVRAAVGDEELEVYGKQGA